VTLFGCEAGAAAYALILSRVHKAQSRGIRMPGQNNALIKSLAQAYRWTRRVEKGGFASLKDMAGHKRIVAFCMIRVM
jgi:hypothetical protein